MTDHFYTRTEPVVKVKLSRAHRQVQDDLTRLIQGKKSFGMKVRSLFISPIAEKDLTISRLVDMDLKTVTADKRILKYLRILQARSQDIKTRPLSLLHTLKLLQGVPLPQEELFYQEVRDKECDGFVTFLDIIGKERRAKEKATKTKGKNESSYDLKAKGQVKPFPHNWSWSFSWTQIIHENLEPILQCTTGEPLGRTLLTRQRRELIDHLIAELFIYFRRGIPTIYLEIVLRRLLAEHPSLSDGTSTTGYVSSKLI